MSLVIDGSPVLDETIEKVLSMNPYVKQSVFFSCC